MLHFLDFAFVVVHSVCTWRACLLSSFFRCCASLSAPTECSVLCCACVCIPCFGCGDALMCIRVACVACVRVVFAV